MYETMIPALIALEFLAVWCIGTGVVMHYGLTHVRISNDHLREMVGEVRRLHVRDIYLDGCKLTGSRVPGEGAHAHYDGDICIFELSSDVHLEWILAHEMAHVAAYNGAGHNEVWRWHMTRLGYGEEGECYEQTPSPHARPHKLFHSIRKGRIRHESRNSHYLHLARQLRRRQSIERWSWPLRMFSWV